MKKHFLFLPFIVTLNACTQAFFHPTKEHNIKVENKQDIFIEKKNNDKLHLWWLPGTSPQTSKTIFFIHGNAGNMSSHYGFVEWLRPQYNIMMFDYSGYGLSDGSPNPYMVTRDTQQVLDYLIENQRLYAPQGIVVYAHSLGATTTVLALSDKKYHHPILKGIVLDAPFSSYRAIAKDKLSLSLVTAWLKIFTPILIPTNLSALERITDLPSIPLYISHSKQDKVIPYSHGKQLFDAATGEKTFYTLKTPYHNHGWSQSEDKAWLQLVLQKL